jgi:DNA processing protein
MKTLKNTHWIYQKISPKEITPIFYKGSTSNISPNSPRVAIIGSRKVSMYTYDFLPYLMRFLLKIQATVVSGGALGVDILAHQIALNHGLTNICLLASPLNKISPRENQLIIDQISKSGIVLSTQAPFVNTQKYMFLSRNKMLVDLADIIIIPQAQLKSGTMQTGEYALKQNKPVFVLPSRCFDIPFLGNLELIRKGAYLLGDFRDLFDYDPIFQRYEKYLEKHIAPLRSKVKNASKYNSVQILDKLTDQLGL